ncbi:MAG: hypothetical protein ACE10G_12755, partial [Gemmatimonadales bacterium]
MHVLNCPSLILASPSLPAGTWQAFSVVREGVRQDLQRDLTVELRVAGPPDFPHAAFADLGGNLVRAEGGAGLHGHQSVGSG